MTIPLSLRRWNVQLWILLTILLIPRTILKIILRLDFFIPAGLFALDDRIYDAVAKKIVERIVGQYPEKAAIKSEIDKFYVLRILLDVFEDFLFGLDDETVQFMKSKKVSGSVKKLIISADVQMASRKLAENGYQRTRFTSGLVQSFVSGIEVVPHKKFPQLHKVRLEFETFLRVEVLKNLTYYAIIRSPIVR